MSAINGEKYGALLASTLPGVIETEDELDRLTEIVERLITKDIKEGSLSPEEDKLLELLTRLIEDYEREHYSIDD